MINPARRTGDATRAEIQRVALSLFIAKGYEATSLREIAEQVGITKAALYYHFESKEGIVRSGMQSRGAEAAELVAWAREQEPGEDLVERAVHRWLDAASVEKLRGIRFMNANPTIMRVMNDPSGIGGNLETLVEVVAGVNADPERLLLIRMAFLSINSAVTAAQGLQIGDDEIISAARKAASAVLTRLREHPPRRPAL